MGIHDLTVRDVIYKEPLHRKDRVAFIHGDQRWSFGRFAEDVDSLAGAFSFLGIKKGDRAADLSLNSYTYFLLYGAAAAVGAILVPLNWRSKQEEVEAVMEMCTPRVVVVEPEFCGMAAEVKRQASIWTTIAICEVNHVDDEAQAGERR